MGLGDGKVVVVEPGVAVRVATEVAVLGGVGVLVGNAVDVLVAVGEGMAVAEPGFRGMTFVPAGRLAKSFAAYIDEAIPAANAFCAAAELSMT